LVAKPQRSNDSLVTDKYEQSSSEESTDENYDPSSESGSTKGRFEEVGDSLKKVLVDCL
jgi:hypothetical protein